VQGLPIPLRRAADVGSLAAGALATTSTDATASGAITADVAADSARRCVEEGSGFRV